MNYSKDKKQSKKEKFAEWIRDNRVQSSVVIFVMLVGFGSVGLWAKNLFGDKELPATSELSTDSLVKIPGWWYNEHFGQSVCESEECADESDPDQDKLSNSQEFFYNSNPMNRDTNSNGLTDGEDVAFGYAPNKPGKVTFEEALSDDNVVGESLLYSEEINDVINSMSDLSKIAIPEISDTEIKLIEDISQNSFTDYMLAMDSIAKKYNPSSDSYSFLENAIKSQDVDALEEIKQLAATISYEYRQVPVPMNLKQLHKNHLVLWKILPDVIVVPQVDSAAGISMVYDDRINQWYDKVQIMIALNQKIELEIRQLRNQYEFEINKDEQ